MLHDTETRRNSLVRLRFFSDPSARFSNAAFDPTPGDEHAPLDPEEDRNACEIVPARRFAARIRFRSACEDGVPKRTWNVESGWSAACESSRRGPRRKAKQRARRVASSSPSRRLGNRIHSFASRGIWKGYEVRRARKVQDVASLYDRQGFDGRSQEGSHPRSYASLEKGIEGRRSQRVRKEERDLVEDGRASAQRQLQAQRRR